MKLYTVNVIEKIDESIVVNSFDDTKTGNQQAEKLFQDLLKEYNISIEIIKTGLEDGVYVYDSSYSVYIVHSN